MSKDENLKRKYRICIHFNQKEFKVFNKYCKKYKIKNKSRFIREAVMRAIIEQMVDKDYPTLFEKINNHEQNISSDKQVNTITNEQLTTTTNTTPHPKLFDTNEITQKSKIEKPEEF